MRFVIASIIAILLLGAVTLYFSDLYRQRDHGLDLVAADDNIAERFEEDEIAVAGARERVSLDAARPSIGAPLMVPGQSAQNTEKYEKVNPNPVKRAALEPLSTFSADVDTASYAVARRYITRNGELPPSNAVRVEEMLNYFDYDYAAPESAEKPFKPTVWVTPSPWRAGAMLMHIGVKGFDLQPEEIPAANIVFLLDVSGSMDDPDKLPLVKQSVKLMLDELGENDTVAIVVYAGAAGVVLEPTPGSKRTKITEALNRLSAGGSTAGGEGIALAYSLAEENFSPNKVNRIILATDGDFNVGVVDADSLEDFVARKRKTGIFLTVLGFGAGNYNDLIAQRLAQSGNGVAAYIDTLNEARKVLVREFRSTVFPIATDVKFQVEFNPAVVAEYRLIGYETRLLDAEDFNNDAIDAGDIGSGHTVTALYELALVGSDARLIDDLRYEAPLNTSGSKEEYAFVKLRYKLPEAGESELITLPVRVADAYASLDESPADSRFAAAVAAFGQKLQLTGDVDKFSFESIIALAQSAKGDDPYGDRAEFIQIARAAASIDTKSRREK